MPHFIVDCSESVLTLRPAEKILQEIHAVAEATGLFKKGDIKVRIRPFRDFTVGNTKDDFIHIFGHIMQGRTVEQKADLSKRMITKLKSMFPDVRVISMNVSDFEKASYCNRNMVD